MKLQSPYTTPALVEDINTTAVGADSSPQGFTDVGGTAYFSADDGAAGIELWMSTSPYDAANTSW